MRKEKSGYSTGKDALNKLNHIAVIPDGNRRFAKKHNMEPWQGHLKGAVKIEKFLGWCKKFGIKEVTFYVFSMQNFKRSKEEINHLMDIFRQKFDKLNKYKARINFIGRLYLFSKDIQQKMKLLMNTTRKYKEHKINFAMAYGGQEELIDAVIKTAQQVKDNKISIKQIDKRLFSKNLYMQSEPDLIIRPGGEHRLSDFLPWQSHNSELFFVKKMWPEFEKKDLIKIIKEFKGRRISRGK